MIMSYCGKLYNGTRGSELRHLIENPLQARVWWCSYTSYTSYWGYQLWVIINGIVFTVPNRVPIPYFFIISESSHLDQKHKKNEYTIDISFTLHSTLKRKGHCFLILYKTTWTISMVVQARIHIKQLAIWD